MEGNAATTSEAVNYPKTKRRQGRIAQIVRAKLETSTDSEKSVLAIPDSHSPNVAKRFFDTRKMHENQFLQRLVEEDSSDEPLRSVNASGFSLSKRTSGDGIDEEIEENCELGVAPAEPSVPSIESFQHGFVKIEKALRKFSVTLNPDSIPHGYHDFLEDPSNQVRLAEGENSASRKLIQPRIVQSSEDPLKTNIEETSEPSTSGDILPPISPKSSPVDSIDPIALRSSISTASVPALGISPISVADRRKKIQSTSLKQEDSNSTNTEEMVKLFPTKKVHVFIGTWNMSERTAPDSILHEWLLPKSLDRMPHIFAIGVQEGPVQKQNWDWTGWEISLQRVLGADYVLYHSTWLGVQHMAIFVRREMIWHMSRPQHVSIRTRIVARYKTKGAVAIAVNLFGTSLLFISSHLTAHADRVVDRVGDYKRIVKGLKFPSVLPLHDGQADWDVTNQFDTVFWFGDLNFRLVGPRDEIEHRVLYIMQQEYHVDKLYDHFVREYDELSAFMDGELVFIGFREHPIRFPPTYKYDAGTNVFDTGSKLRVPSYTDRILFKIGKNDQNANHIDCIRYEDVPEICVSDHKPVFAVFSVQLKPGEGRRNSLSTGHFKQSVYVEGVGKKRNDSISGSTKNDSKVPRVASKLCTIS